MRRLSQRDRRPRINAVVAVFSAATLPLVLAPPARAGDDGGTADACRPPDIARSYTTAALQVHVTLPATGCAAREDSTFIVSADLTRNDVVGTQESAGRSARCGPFPSAADRRPGQPPAQYFCELDVALEHPASERSSYRIDVTYPGASGADDTTTVALACRSDGTAAACDDQPQ